MASKLKVEIVVRLALITVVLFNALIPSITVVNAQTNGKPPTVSKTSQSQPNTTLPIPNAAKYQPPKKITRPTRFNPTPDQATSPIPPKIQLNFIYLQIRPSWIPTDRYC